MANKIKKILTLFLVLLIFNFLTVPTMAQNVVDSSFVSDFNINKSSKGQVVQFRSNEQIMLPDGKIIPTGTIFEGKIKSMKKGRCFFKRAKARIVIDKMYLSDGTNQEIKGHTKRHVLKGSAFKNVIKGVTMTPFVIITGVGGAVVMVLEAVTIVGIVAIPPTALGVAGIMGKMSNGVNYKKQAGDNIELVIQD